MGEVVFETAISAQRQFASGCVKVFTGELILTDKPPTDPYEEQAKNILKTELKRHGSTFARIAEYIKMLGAKE